jgi:hypothetical protein
MVAAAVKSGMNNISKSMSAGSYSMPSASVSQGSSYMTRQMNEGYFKVEVEMNLRNDHLAVASARGSRQMEKY